MNKKGFSLIELLIVVVIIAILAAIAIPNFISMQIRAKEGSIKSNMHTVQLAAEDYAVRTAGNYAVDTVNPGLSLFTNWGSDIPTNPFDASGNGIVAGDPTTSGEVGYNHDTFGALENYTIKGYGKDDFLMDAAGQTFILSNDS